MDATYVKERITAIKAQITALETAILELTTGQVQQYTLDTGQSRQVVIVQDVPRLQKTLDGLYNQLATFCARLNGSGIQGAPGW